MPIRALFQKVLVGRPLAISILFPAHSNLPFLSQFGFSGYLRDHSYRCFWSLPVKTIVTFTIKAGLQFTVRPIIFCFDSPVISQPSPLHYWLPLNRYFLSGFRWHDLVSITHNKIGRQGVGNNMSTSLVGFLQQVLL